MSSFWEEHMTKYIRNESIIPNNNNDENMRSIDSTGCNCDGSNNRYSTQQQPIFITSPLENVNPDYSELDETIDIDIAWRCTVYMSGLKCHKGEYCDKIHRFPREDKVVCKYMNREGCCPRPASECWFWHPGQRIKFVPDDDAPLLVQSMGDIMMYIRKELVKDPNKYKSRSTRQPGPQ